MVFFSSLLFDRDVYMLVPLDLYSLVLNLNGVNENNASKKDDKSAKQNIIYQSSSSRSVFNFEFRLSNELEFLLRFDFDMLSVRNVYTVWQRRKKH